MSTARAPARTSRPPSGRYVIAAWDGTRLVEPAAEELAPAANVRELAVKVAHLGRDVIVYAHERVGAAWALGPHRGRELPPALDGAVAKGDAWVIFEHPGGTVHVYLAAWGGTWKGTGGARGLFEAAAAFRDGLGFAWAFSGPSTLHHLIRATGKVGVPEPLPPMTGTADSAWRVPAHEWSRVLTAHRELPWARAFDRNGSYLAAWRGTNLADGEWDHRGIGELLPGGESSKPAGYWRLPDDWLAMGAEWGLPDPLERLGDGPVWLTTPLAQLVADQLGEPVPYAESWTATRSRRAMDTAGERVVAARDALPAGSVAREALKEAYAGATAWLEWGPGPPAPLHRPDWRHTIVDRHVANTWRALDRCALAPFALGGIDAALFAVAGPTSYPPGLRTGDGVGAWKPTGPGCPLDEAVAALEAGGVPAALRAVKGA